MNRGKVLLRVMRYVDRHDVKSLGEFIGFVLSDIRTGDGR